MALSAVVSRGHIALPAGTSWADAIQLPARRAQLILEFQARAAAALELPLASLQLSQMLHLPRSGGPPGKTHWHRDASYRVGHVLMVAGGPPTEFLLGSYPDVYLEAGERLGELEDQLELWRPAPGEVVWYDRYAIHRSPAAIAAVTEPRLFLLATQRK